MVESFFDQVHAGEFNLLHFSVSLTRAWTGELPVRAHADRTQLMAGWMEHTSLYHEYRHFHDLVGTSSGLHTMLRVTRLVDWFLEYANSSRESLRVPLRQRDPRSKIVAIYDGYQRFLRVICGDLPALPDAGESGLVVEDVAALGMNLKVPRFTLTDYDPTTGAPRNRSVPIGMRALVEATALETQMFLSVVGSGPLEAADENETTERGLHILGEWSRIVRGGYLIPYAVCQFLFHYATRVYPTLGDLTAFCEAALMYSGYSEAAFPDDPQTFDPPGIVFTNLVGAHAKLRTAGSQLQQVGAAAGYLKLPAYEEVIERMADRAARDPYCIAPEPLRPQAAKSEFIASIQEFLFRDFAMVVKAKASAPADWMLAPKYLGMYRNLPMPPLVAIAASPVVNREKRELVLWVEWIFVLAILGDLIEKPRLECPIRFRMPALGSIFRFPDSSRPGTETSCVPFMEKKCCGTYNGGFQPDQPSACPFVSNIERVVGSFTFKKIEFPAQEDHREYTV